MMRAGIYRMPEGRRSWQAVLPDNAPRYDAIVAGGGTAGAISAIALAERGLRVLVIERLGALGGMSTQGAISSYYYGSVGGLYEQVDIAARAWEQHGFVGRTAKGFSGELKARELEKRVRAAGGEIAFQADLTGVLMEDGKVLGVEYAQDDGLHAAYAHVVIDATAEAYVCLLAGAEYEQGRSLDGKVQPYSNVRLEFHEQAMRLSHGYMDSGYVDPTDPEQYTQAVMSAAKYACYLRDDYREGPRLVGMAQCVGMREGPLVEGDERVRFQDVVEGRNPTQSILFTAYSNADNHGKDMAFENTAQQDWMIACSLWGLNFTVNIPVGAVIPKGIDGLLMAGRMISVDHDLASCVRQQRDIQKCGEAVGLLAAEAVTRGVSVREVPYEALETPLRRSGCLMEQNRLGFVDSRGDHPIAHFPETIEAVREGLASTEPGMAMWAVRNMKDAMPIRALLDEGGHLAVHAAMALALAGDDAGAPILLKCVEERDSFIPNTSRKYNMIRGAAVLYLLGRLAWKPALPMILGLIKDWERIEFADFQPDEFLKDMEEYRFQYLSQAIMAAMAVAKIHPETWDEVDKTVHGVIDRPDFSIHSTLKGWMQLKYQMAPMIRNAVKRAEAQR